MKGNAVDGKPMSWLRADIFKIIVNIPDLHHGITASADKVFSIGRILQGKNGVFMCFFYPFFQIQRCCIEDVNAMIACTNCQFMAFFGKSDAPE